MNIDWASLSRSQHAAVFETLRTVHTDVINRVKIKDGHDNSDLFAIASDLNQAMHAGNDDLVRREHRFERASCDCGVCP
jgi:hypothetical protein